MLGLDFIGVKSQIMMKNGIRNNVKFQVMTQEEYNRNWN